MIHHALVMLQSLASGLSAHLAQWVGWAALLVAALFGLQRSRVWLPAAVALIVNPSTFGLLGDLVHGRAGGVQAALVFTLVQAVLAYAGYGLGRLVLRFR